MILIVQPHC